MYAKGGDSYSCSSGTQWWVGNVGINCGLLDCWILVMGGGEWMGWIYAVSWITGGSTSVSMCVDFVFCDIKLLLLQVKFVNESCCCLLFFFQSLTIV